MKRVILILLCVVSFSCVWGQQGNVDFLSVMTAFRKGGAIDIIDIIEDESCEYKVAIKSTVKETGKLPPELKQIGEAIDLMQLVDYELDTLCIFCEYDFITHDIYKLNISTNKGFYIGTLRENGKWLFKYIEDIYVEAPFYKQVYINSDRILYETVLTGDIEKIISMLKSVGYVSGDGWAYIDRIIIKNRKVENEGIIYYKPPIIWAPVEELLPSTHPNHKARNRGR